MARRHHKNKKLTAAPAEAPLSAEHTPLPETDTTEAPSSYDEEDEALEAFGPERDEIFFEEEPKPFAVSVREILDEYRSDSTPARYAMAVELGEADDWEVYLGPPSEVQGEPIYPRDGREVQSILHATWSAANPPEEAYPRTGDHHRGIDSSPLEEPPSTAASGGYAAPAVPGWMDILKEYRMNPGLYDAQDESSAERGQRAMTQMDGKPDMELEAGLSSDAVVDADGLPLGIRPLTQRHAEAQPARSSGHLSVEDILAEFHGYAPAEPVEERPKPVEPETEPIPAPKRRSRRASMEEEARSLFSSVLHRTPEPEAESGEALPEEPPVENEAPAPAPESVSAVEDFEVHLPPEAQLPMEEPVQIDIDEVDSAGDASEEAPPRLSPLDGLKARVRGFGRKKKARAPAESQPEPEGSREHIEGAEDEDVSPAAYAVDDEYESEEPDTAAFPSFGEYLTGLVSGLLIRVRGLGGSNTGETMEADEEDLGPEVKPAAASHYYGSFVTSLRLRFRIGLGLWLVLAYISLGLPASGMLRTVEVASGMCLGLQLGIMLLSLDVISNAIINLSRGRFGADALAVLSCLLTSIDALVVLLDGFGSPQIPLCLISSFSLLGVLFSSLLSARGLRKALRVPAIGKRAFSITAEAELTDKTITLVKSSRPVSGFVRRSEEAAPDETAYNRAAPLLLILAFLMSLVAVLVKKSTGDLLFVLTAILAPAVPVTALLCYALPFFVGSERIFSSGAAIAGWSGLCDIGSSHNLIVTDRDLFPEHNVEIDTIRIFADEPSEKIIAYAGSMISASGAGIASCFAELMERNNCSMCQIEDFEFLTGGGFRGRIEGQMVLCGGTELMRLMNVRIPYRLVGKTSVLLAIDGVLYGIFNMKYEPNPTVRRALIGLIRSNRHPVFAIRDFNVNPEMLHETFDVATDGYDFPPYVERFTISEAQPSAERKIAAVLCREGLGPLVHMADTGRSMYITIRINLMISLLASVIGVFAVFFQLLTAGTISMAALFLYAIVWILPVAIVSLFVRF